MGILWNYLGSINIDQPERFTKVLRYSSRAHRVLFKLLNGAFSKSGPILV